MTVAELIRELQAMPNQLAPVRVVQRYVWTIGENGGELQALGEDDSTDAEDVRHEGAFVLIWGK